MDENKNVSPYFPTGKKELRLCGIILLLSVLLADFVIYGGLNLGFALTAAGGVIAAWSYLRRSGCRPTGYSTALLLLSLVICGSFVRSNDYFVKFIMFCFLILSVCLGLGLLAGQNQWNPSRILFLLDIPRILFGFGLMKMNDSLGGLNEARKHSGSSGKKRMAVLTGLAVAVPILLILIPLLIRADAAFEGLLELLPKISLQEPFTAVILGFPIACVAYTMVVALKHSPRDTVPIVSIAGLNPLTVNTALGAVCAVYLCYLFSQLAYFSGGLSGILPSEFTMAEYARRGFFEMAWLSAINLGLMTAAVGLAARKDGRAPLATRCLALFIGIVTLFFVVTASAKMGMYIASYGLTRLRVLTEVIMIFIGLTVIFVSIWLFVPKLPYMKVVLLTALIMGAAVAWTDVDTVVAAYNVKTYQQGGLACPDIAYLSTLSDGAVPYLEELTHDEDPKIAADAENALRFYENHKEISDFRGITIAGLLAEEILEKAS